MSPDHPNFGRRGTRDFQEASVPNPQRIELMIQYASVLIIAADAGDGYLTAQSRQIVRYIGGATKHVFCFSYLCHRNRSFRRYTGHIGKIIAVQHHVPDHEDPYARDFFKPWMHL